MSWSAHIDCEIYSTLEIINEILERMVLCSFITETERVELITGEESLKGCGYRNLLELESGGNIHFIRSPDEVNLAMKGTFWNLGRYIHVWCYDLCKKSIASKEYFNCHIFITSYDGGPYAGYFYNMGGDFYGRELADYTQEQEYEDGIVLGIRFLKPKEIDDEPGRECKSS